jgi:hypothetical protein
MMPDTDTTKIYVAEDGLGTPALWFTEPSDGTEQHLISKDDLRVSLNRGAPAYWGAPSREPYVERVWNVLVAAVERGDL